MIQQNHATMCKRECKLASVLLFEYLVHGTKEGKPNSLKCGNVTKFEGKCHYFHNCYRIYAKFEL